MSRRDGYGFGSLARDFAADVVMGEGGDRDEVREGFSDADLDRIAREHRAEFNWDLVYGMSTSVREWYMIAWHDDPHGPSIREDATFTDVVRAFPEGAEGVDAALGQGSDTMRGRVLHEIADIIGCGYDDIHAAVLTSDRLDPCLIPAPEPPAGQRYTAVDVEMKHSPRWPNGPRVLEAELPDGRVLGYVASTSPWSWSWRLADDTQWRAPEPVRGNAARFIDQDGREAAILSLLDAIDDILADERAAESDGNEPGLPELDDLVDGPSVVRGPAR